MTPPTFSMATSSLDYWRGFFRAAGDSDIFHVIRQALRVAASDHPDEFKSRRDEIAQMLFAGPQSVVKADEGRGNAVEAIEVKAIEDKEDDGCGDAVKAFDEVKTSDGALFPPVTPSEEQKPEHAAVAVDDEEKSDTMKRETWKVSVSEEGKIRLTRLLVDQTTKPSDPQTRTSTEHPPVIAPEPRNQGGSLPTSTEHPPVIAPEPRNQGGSLPTSTEHPPVIAPEPRNQGGSLPTFTEHQAAEPPVLINIAPSTGHPQGSWLQRTSTKHKPEPPVIVVAQPEPPRLLPISMRLDDASLRSKLEMSKRKLRQGYQQTENAKRQRRIQVIQPRAEIPKDSNKKPLLFKSLGTWLR